MNESDYDGCRDHANSESHTLANSMNRYSERLPPLGDGISKSLPVLIPGAVEAPYGVVDALDLGPSEPPDDNESFSSTGDASGHLVGSERGHLATRRSQR